MSYQGYTSRAEALSTSPAIHQLRFRVLIHELSVKNFSIVADRIAMKDSLSNIETHFDLFSISKRFPDNGFYVFLDLDDWNKKWQDLQSALDFKSSDKDPKKYPKSQIHTSTISQSNNNGDEERAQWDYNDASQVFRNTLRIMSNQLATLEGLLNRTSFEQSFHINWVDTSTLSYFQNFPISFRLRAFLVDPLQLDNEAWPALINTNNLYELPDTPILVDYIYLWGSRSVAERPRLRLDINTGKIDGCVSVVTAD